MMITKKRCFNFSF